jgi:hypothetical protein
VVSGGRYGRRVIQQPPSPAPDDKDWTWVLREHCPECGFDAASLDRDDIPAIVRSAVAAFVAALDRDDAIVRPSPEVWSPLEYACHVRDVCRIFDMRLRMMLTEDDPVFTNWDQDATALDERYWTQDRSTVAGELAGAAEQIANDFAAVAGADWQRPGRRSNGSVFTVDSFGRYFVHDLVHHAHDIGAPPH